MSYIFGEKANWLKCRSWRNHSICFIRIIFSICWKGCFSYLPCCVTHHYNNHWIKVIELINYNNTIIIQFVSILSFSTSDRITYWYYYLGKRMYSSCCYSSCRIIFYWYVQCYRCRFHVTVMWSVYVYIEWSVTFLVFCLIVCFSHFFACLTVVMTLDHTVVVYLIVISVLDTFKIFFLILKKMFYGIFKF